MSLLEFWKRSKDDLSSKDLKQIIPLAGKGKLLDGSEASKEFRDFLSFIPSNLLVKYSSECLSERFPDSGLALQDIVNEIGVRIGFEVTHGKYRSKYDGLWKYKNGDAIVVEVETSDTYLTDLTRVVKYRKELAQNNEINMETTYFLWVVGEENTGGFEAQIRGSKYAWDMRIISIASLCKLMLLREDVDDPLVIKQIHDVLIPREYTKLDNIIDLLFVTAKKIKYEEETEGKDNEQVDRTTSEEKKVSPVSFHSSVIDIVKKHISEDLVKRTKSTYISKIDNIGVVCIVSKLHSPDKNPNFWFAFHPHQKEFLENVNKGHIALGCGSPDSILLVPSNEFISWVKESWITESDGRMYWHVVIFRDGDSFIMHRKKGSSSVDLSQFLIRD